MIQKTITGTYWNYFGLSSISKYLDFVPVFAMLFSTKSDESGEKHGETLRLGCPSSQDMPLSRLSEANGMKALNMTQPGLPTQYMSILQKGQSS